MSRRRDLLRENTLPDVAVAEYGRRTPSPPECRMHAYVAIYCAHVVFTAASEMLARVLSQRHEESYVASPPPERRRARRRVVAVAATGEVLPPEHGDRSDARRTSSEMLISIFETVQRAEAAPQSGAERWL